MQRTTFTIIFHLLLMVVAFSLLYVFGFVRYSPLSANLNLCDAYWYNNMRQNGYEYIDNAMCNMAYFPFFPVVWSLSGLDSLGIAVFNLLVFAIAYGLLMTFGRYSVMHMLTLLSLPSFIFFVLPYSESLFFLFGVLMILGYQRNNNSLIFLGILGCGLTRSVSTFFIPAIIVAELISYCNDRPHSKFWTHLKRIFLYSAACLISLATVTAMQVLQTGKWFYFLKIQKFWGRHFEIPQLPFTTAAPERILGVDTIAMICGVCAAFFLLKWFISHFVVASSPDDTVRKIQLPREVIFSMLYLVAIVLLDSFFTDSFNHRTKIWSMNRHIFCTSFFVCFLNWLSMHKPDRIDIKGIVVVVLAGIFLTSLYEYPYHMLYYLLFFSVFLSGYFRRIPLTVPYAKLLAITLYITNIILFMKFFQSFLNDSWVG